MLVVWAFIGGIIFTVFLSVVANLITPPVQGVGIWLVQKVSTKNAERLLRRREKRAARTIAHVAIGILAQEKPAVIALSIVERLLLGVGLIALGLALQQYKGLVNGSVTSGGRIVDSAFHTVCDWGSFLAFAGSAWTMLRFYRLIDTVNRTTKILNQMQEEVKAKAVSQAEPPTTIGQ